MGGARMRPWPMKSLCLGPARQWPYWQLANSGLNPRETGMRRVCFQVGKGGEEKGVHVADMNGFRPFDFTVGGSLSKVLQDSCCGDFQGQGRECEAGRCEHAQWPRFTFPLQCLWRVRWVDIRALPAKPGPKFRVETAWSCALKDSGRPGFAEFMRDLLSCD